ncbi:MAG: hypothetical protein HC860_16260 [Alkalinema sp. RU_4_3]|nr:hypothetical protein [Alkalinema sp. RU_4_3]
MFQPTRYRGYTIDRFIMRRTFYADPIDAYLTTECLRAGTLTEVKAMIDEVLDEPPIDDLFKEADRIMSKPLYQTAA